MRRLVVAVALAALVGVGLYLWHDRADRSTVSPASGDGSAPSTTGTATVTGSGSRPSSRVRKLLPEDRRRLAEAIAKARDRRRTTASAPTPTAQTSGAAPALPDDTIQLEQVSATLKAALEEAIPILADCYPRAGSHGGKRTAVVMMVMTSEPEVGTVIDTSELHDEHGQPLARELDDCLRTTIESLGLPPLDQGGKLPLQYSFVFD